MSDNDNSKTLQLRHAIKSILWEQWNPIKLDTSNTELSNEYDNYEPHLLKLALNDADAGQIASHLTHIVEVNIGLNGNSTRENTAAQLIIDAKNRIFGNATP